jgi:hypothetical protein
VQAWIKAEVPGPLSSLGSADFRKLPPEVKREVLGMALEKDRTSWPPSIGRREWFLTLDHPGGHAVALRAILARDRPQITVEDCGAIVAAATFEEILPAFSAALGIFGPKSPAPPTTGPKSNGAPRTTSGKRPSSSSKPRGGRRPTSSASPSGNSGTTSTPGKSPGQAA